MLRFSFVCLLFLGFYHLSIAQHPSISGSFKAYQKLTFSWEGPMLAEEKATFLNYRLDVKFTTPDGRDILVPGYFAADGKAMESGAESGNTWRAHLLPLVPGKWKYKVNFSQGERNAISSENNRGTRLSLKGDKGSFTVMPAETSAPGFLAKGKLQYIGQHFLQFTDGDHFLKMGANSPEVLLEYEGFDGTNSERKYPEHFGDWENGDPLWHGSKGKGIVGVINYLKEQGINAHYFLLMNAYGDGKQAYPWIGPDDFYQYDVSKLDQWQLLFDHMMNEGVMPQFVLSEQENQSYFEYKEGGDFADSRKVFYREMAARFGYLNAVTWNIGEESGWEKEPTYGKAVTTAQRKEFAVYLSDLLPYEELIVVHNGPSTTDAIFEGLVGYPSFTGISFQGNYQDVSHGYGRISHWRKASAAAGHPWVVTYDEPYTNPEFPDIATWRKNALWASLMAGAAGMEIYIGKGEDLKIQDYRKYSAYWKVMNHAGSFFIKSDIPFYQLKPKPSGNANSWMLTDDKDFFVVYLPEGGEGELSLPSSLFDIHWFDPRKGQWLQNENLKEVSGGRKLSIGKAPKDPDLDWAVVVKRKKK